MTRKDIKQFEKHKTDQLLNTLSINAKFNHFGREGQEADVVYIVNVKELGVEVVTAYHDNYQAKTEWGLRRGKIKIPKAGIGLFEEVKINPDEEMLKNLQAEIVKKCQKNLQGKYNNRTWLCVFENSPLSDDETIEYFRKNLTVPDHKFEKIYLLHLSPNGGGYKAWELNGT